jgi:tetratricopeptide (TPR) repeat protein
LAVFYPHHVLGILEVTVAVCFLAGVSLLVVSRLRAQPYLAVGWFWFFGMLVPTIGLVQVSSQAMADRYSYLPTVGLWIMVAWGVKDWIGDRASFRTAATLAGALAVIACIIATPFQVRYWQDSRTLFMRAANVTNQNYLAYYNLGCYAKDDGDYAQAIVYFKKALSAEADDAPLAEHARAYNNLGYAYFHQGEITNAVAGFEKALKLQPRYPEAYYNLGRAFLTNNQPDVAADCFQRALSLNPNVAEIHNKLAYALAQCGRPAEAIAQYSQALQLSPSLDDAANNLALLLATCSDRSLRDGIRAVALARQASGRSHDQNPVFLGTLAAALAEEGKLSEAAATAQRARELALAQNNQPLAGKLEAQWQRYKDGNGGSHP